MGRNSTGDATGSLPDEALRPMARELQLWGAAFGGFAAFFAVHPVRSSDPFWRLNQGRVILEQRARTLTEFSAFPDFSDPVVAPQWLWDASTYLIYQAGSWTGLAIFQCLLVFAVVFTVVHLIGESGQLRSRSALLLVSTLTVCVVMARVRLRPQTVSMLLVPGFLLLLYRYCEAEGRRRLLLGISLVGVEVAWAQLHGSFVLAPFLFAIVVGIDTFKHRRESWPNDFILFQVLLIGLLSSAHGLEIVSYITDHGSGFATQHIKEMTSPTWASFNPAVNLYAPIYLFMSLLVVAAMLRARRIWWCELALAGFGLVLGMTAVRFFALGAILLAPLAVKAVSAALESVAGERASATLRASTVLISVVLLTLVAQEKRDNLGPIPAIGPAEGYQPRAAARYLLEKGAAEHWNVLTDYNLSGQLGFWFAGALRTYVDPRTPAYFDDSDFGLALEVWGDAGALARGLERYDAQAAVALRNTKLCGNLSASWVPVVVEPRSTAFVRPGLAEPLTHLAACGPSFLADNACEDDGSFLDAEIDRMSRLGETAFVDYLRAERIVQCGGSLDEVPALIPAPHEAREYKQARNRLLAALQIRRGDEASALEAVAEDIMAGDITSYMWASRLLANSKAIPLERRREIVEALVEIADDAVPPHMRPGLRSILAHLCAGLGDAECTRFHALRAAARGEPSAASSLEWLSKNHSSERVRREATRWREILLSE